MEADMAEKIGKLKRSSIVSMSVTRSHLRTRLFTLPNICLTSRQESLPIAVPMRSNANAVKKRPVPCAAPILMLTLCN